MSVECDRRWWQRPETRHKYDWKTSEWIAERLDRCWAAAELFSWDNACQRASADDQRSSIHFYTDTHSKTLTIHTDITWLHDFISTWHHHHHHHHQIAQVHCINPVPVCPRRRVLVHSAWMPKNVLSAICWIYDLHVRPVWPRGQERVHIATNCDNARWTGTWSSSLTSIWSKLIIHLTMWTVSQHCD